MGFSFRAKIFKVGINACVKVPLRITDIMHKQKGYIPIKGFIGEFGFQQTLVPVKNGAYRLYVNGIMLKGAGLKIGQTASFAIEEDLSDRSSAVPINPEFKKALVEHGLVSTFEQLIPSRKKDINRYLNHLKTETALKKNVEKLIRRMKEK